MPHPINTWLNKTYWASSVFNIGSTWYAYSAVKVGTAGDPDPHHYGRFCLTVARAPRARSARSVTSAAAGRSSARPPSTDPSGSIDPYPYHDPATGKNYLLWKAAGKIGVARVGPHVGRARHQRPAEPGVAPVALLQTNRAAAWEGGTIENPSMVTFNGTTYLFYSANDSAWQDADGRSNYATGYAICPGPRGACTRPSGGRRRCWRAAASTRVRAEPHRWSTRAASFTWRTPRTGSARTATATTPGGCTSPASSRTRPPA